MRSDEELYTIVYDTFNETAREYGMLIMVPVGCYLAGIKAVRNAVLDDLIEEAGEMLTVTEERQQVQLADWLRSHREQP